ncbi:MAG: hypothetical protein AAGD13_01410 [Pseudomonadota bacterium]
MPLSTELTALRDGPIDFLRENWITPGSGYTMHAPAGPQAYIALERVFTGDVTTIDSTLRLTNNRDKIGYARLVPATPGKMTLEYRSHRQLANHERGDYLPTWFLPWYSDHVTKMKILQRGLLPPNVPDPDIFFTSALSGCSVFIEGPPNAPTVYHGGFSDVRDFTVNPRVIDPLTGVEADSITHWRVLFQQMAPGAVGVGEANKAQYMNQGGRETDDVRAYKRFLAAEHQNEMRIEEMTSEGMVFGTRDAQGDWSFFLQESVTVTIYTLRKRKIRRTLIDSERRTYTRPMMIRQIYPTGGATWGTWNLTRLF